MQSLHLRSGEPLPSVQRLAVLRANAIGDYMVSLPALHALRQAYRQARITLLGRAWHAEFLRGRPGPVDETLVLPALPGITVEARAAADAEAIERCVAMLRERRFDLVLQLHGGGRYSNGFVRRLGAALTVGFRSPEAPALDLCVPYLDDHHPVALQLLECTALVGADSAPLSPRLDLRASDEQEAQAVLPSDGRPLVVLQPGASHPHKRWPVERFAAVGDVLAARGATVAVNGTAGEAELTAAVTGAMRQPARDLAGRLTLGGLAALLSRASLMVTNDTGPMHLARALGTPTVAIMWVGNARSFGPLVTQGQRLATAWRMNCPQCGRNAMTEGCDHEVSLLDEVSVEDVLDLADTLPASPPAPAWESLQSAAQ
jgi:ADP-heptose:LPS heptosyltransferase